MVVSLEIGSLVRVEQDEQEWYGEILNFNYAEGEVLVQKIEQHEQEDVDATGIADRSKSVSKGKAWMMRTKRILFRLFSFALVVNILLYFTVIEVGNATRPVVFTGLLGLIMLLFASPTGRSVIPTGENLRSFARSVWQNNKATAILVVSVLMIFTLLFFPYPHAYGFNDPPSTSVKGQANSEAVENQSWRFHDWDGDGVNNLNDSHPFDAELSLAPTQGAQISSFPVDSQLEIEFCTNGGKVLCMDVTDASLGDMNGDGHLDLVITSAGWSNSADDTYTEDWGRIVYYHGNEYGIIDEVHDYKLNKRSSDPWFDRSRNGQVWEVDVADVDGDGSLDALATYDEGLTNGPAGTGYDCGEGKGPAGGISLADFDLDGSVDFIYYCNGDPEDDIAPGGFLLNNSGIGITGLSMSQNGFEGFDWPDLLGWIDDDGDGYLELIACTSHCHVIDNVNGTLVDSAYSLRFPGNPISYAVGDVDGDGDFDLAVGNDFGSIHLYLNPDDFESGRSSWQSRGDFLETHSLFWADMDGDGDQDLVAGNDGRDQIYENINWTLSKEPAWQSSSSADTRALMPGDLDGDGDLDLVAVSNGGWFGSDMVRIYYNEEVPDSDGDGIPDDRDCQDSRDNNCFAAAVGLGLYTWNPFAFFIWVIVPSLVIGIILYVRLVRFKRIGDAEIMMKYKSIVQELDDALSPAAGSVFDKAGDVLGYDRGQFDNMTVHQLKSKLRDQGLKQAGNKAELLKRLKSERRSYVSIWYELCAARQTAFWRGETPTTHYYDDPSIIPDGVLEELDLWDSRVKKLNEERRLLKAQHLVRVLESDIAQAREDVSQVRIEIQAGNLPEWDLTGRFPWRTELATITNRIHGLQWPDGMPNNLRSSFDELSDDVDRLEDELEAARLAHKEKVDLEAQQAEIRRLSEIAALALEALREEHASAVDGIRRDLDACRVVILPRTAKVTSDLESILANSPNDSDGYEVQLQELSSLARRAKAARDETAKLDNDRNQLKSRIQMDTHIHTIPGDVLESLLAIPLDEGMLKKDLLESIEEAQRLLNKVKRTKKVDLELLPSDVTLHGEEWSNFSFILRQNGIANLEIRGIEFEERNSYTFERVSKTDTLPGSSEFQIEVYGRFVGYGDAMEVTCNVEYTTHNQTQAKTQKLMTTVKVLPRGGVEPKPSQVPRAPSDFEQRYQAEALISVGGMSQVFDAVEISSGQTVVWKEAWDRHNDLPAVNKQLRDESELLESLDHPRIPKFHASGTKTNNKGQIVEILIMEKIDGRNLRDLVQAAKLMDQPLRFDRSMRIMKELCEPLEYIAERDVYHRDLKPSNILLNSDRGVVLIDYGMAKQVEAGTDVSHTTGQTEGWAPPERNDGVSGSFTDVYSLGQILWHMLTGENPRILTGSDVEKIEELGHPRWIGDLVLKATVPTPHSKRIQTVAEFRMRLENMGELPSS